MDLVQMVTECSDPSDRINPVVWRRLVDVVGLGECPESLPTHFRQRTMSLARNLYEIHFLAHTQFI